MSNIESRVFQFEGEITATQRNYFEEYGIIQFKQFINRDTVSLFLNEVKQVESALLSKGIEKVNGIPLKFGRDVDGSPLIQRIAFTSLFSKTLGNFLKHDSISKLLSLLDPYLARIGEKEKDGLVFNHYVNTELSKYSKLGWHTDSPRDLFLGSRILPMLNIGLHLDDCPFSHGGLRVIPGTHKQGLARLLFRKKYFIDHTPDEREVGFNIEAGDLTIHDGRLWHRVEQSPFTGELSRRRVLYFPVIAGRYQPKHEGSPTPLYHKLGQFSFKRQIKPKPATIKSTLTNDSLATEKHSLA